MQYSVIGAIMQDARVLREQISVIANIAVMRHSYLQTFQKKKTGEGSVYASRLENRKNIVLPLNFFEDLKTIHNTKLD